MKRITLIAFLSFLATYSFAQQTLVGLYGGAGFGTVDNYDAGLSAGLDFVKVYANHAAFGFKLFYQSYGVGYDNEAYGVRGGNGNAGVLVLNKSAYVFLAPKFEFSFGSQGIVHAYLDAGVGFNMSGTETMRKFDKSNGSSVGNYDSTITTTPNLTKLLFRVGTGLTEYLVTGQHWAVTFTEDFGFIAQNLSSTSDYDNPSRTQYSPRSMKPGYISLQIGITHIGYKSK